MAVSLPIVTEFDGKGIKKAIAQFQQLETTGEKAQFALKKAAIGAGVALAGLAVAIGDATKAAMEDAQAQALLAQQLKNSTGATEAQVAQTEKFIASMARAGAITDDELRPAMAALVRGTKDLTEAQRVMSVAMDVSRATGIDLTTVSDALAKAYQGNYKALRSLSPEMAALIKEGASLNEIINVLVASYGGSYAAFAESAAGQTANFANTLNEAKESLGAAFLPVLEDALPVLQSFADWAGKNTDALKFMTIAIGGTAAATIVLNAAMAANPYVLMAGGIGAVTIAIGRLREELRGTSRWVNAFIDEIGRMLAPLLRIIDAYNALARGLGFKEISFGGTNKEFAPGGFGYSGDNRGDMPGGFGTTVALPALATVPAAAVGPTSGVSSGGRSGGMAGASGPTGGGQSFASLGFGAIGLGWDLDKIDFGPPIEININGGLATSAEVGQAVVDAIKQYTNVSGPANIAVA